MIETELEALAAAVDEVVSAVRAAGDIAAWDFDDAGPAVADWTANEQPSGWGDEPLEDAYRTGALLWNLIADQALSTALLLRAGRPLGLLAQGRALAESCARSWYLLVPDLDPDERVRRMINDRLHALFEDWRLASANSALDSGWQQTTRDRITSVAEQLGYDVRTEGRSTAAFVGDPSRPNTMKLLGEMTGRPDFAALFYRITSSISHAGLHGLVKRLDLASEGPERRYRARLRGISASEAAADVSLPIVALLRTSSALMYQTGWPASDFSDRERELRAILETLMD